MTETIYLIRHGESVFSKNNILGGNTDLTKKGIGHAHLLEEMLKDIKLDVIYCSELVRAQQTAAIIQNKYHPDTPFSVHKKLNEIENGIIDGFTYELFQKHFPELYQARQKDRLNWQFPKGQSYKMKKDQLKGLLFGIQIKEQQNAAIVAHNGTNRTILGHYLELPADIFTNIEIQHEVIFEINPKKKEVHYLKDGQRFEGYKVN